MITHHLLDSLAVHADLAGERIADVGTGAGFPGLPATLALVNRQRQFTSSSTPPPRSCASWSTRCSCSA